MTRDDAVNYFTNKYYEIARKYRIYRKCKANAALKDMCVNMAINCGVEGLECETVDQIPKKQCRYFLMVGDRMIEAIIILAKAKDLERNYATDNKVTKNE